ncbi:LysR substrate-binding domain-containing protein [Plantactinospora sp. CA-294935]|uniref:LysR substrate-binding domain-containing protein n=1 Tax=Plantactinospora sp. CA-294935 TaxID=3240012 RepID=UPI003D8E1558
MDVGLLRDCRDRHGLLLRELACEPRVVLLSESHTLAPKDDVTLNDLRDEPIAYLNGMSPLELQHWAGADLDGRSWRRGPVVGSVSELVTEIKLGRSIALVHGSAMPDHSTPGIVARPVAGLSPSRLELATPAHGTRPIVTEFAAHLLATARRPAVAA